MKTIFTLLVASFIISAMHAQSWKITLYKVSGKPKIKEVKFKPERKITVQRFVLETDTLNVTETYNGIFSGIHADTMEIKLSDYSEYKKYSNGISLQRKIPGLLYFNSNSKTQEIVKMPYSEIHAFNYRPVKNEKLAGIAEGMVFTFLGGVLLSPLVCYNFKEGYFDADRYKYWGLISSIGLTSSFCLEILTNRSKRFQFKEGWPVKKEKVWSFSKTAKTVD